MNIDPLIEVCDAKFVRRQDSLNGICWYIIVWTDSEQNFVANQHVGRSVTRHLKHHGNCRWGDDILKQTVHGGHRTDVEKSVLSYWRVMEGPRGDVEPSSPCLNISQLSSIHKKIIVSRPACIKSPKYIVSHYSLQPCITRETNKPPKGRVLQEVSVAPSGIAEQSMSTQ